jgi:hypothetical protein
MGKRKTTGRNRTTKAKGLKLRVRQQDVKGGWSWGVSPIGAPLIATPPRIDPVRNVPAVP